MSTKKKTRKRDEVLQEIKYLVLSPGYIYSLCMICASDFYMEVESMHNIDYHERLSVNEVELLIGFLLQMPIDLRYPDPFTELLPRKKKTYELMQELHETFHEDFYRRMKESHETSKEKRDVQKFFNRGSLHVEPIFYSGSGAYDFQYLDFSKRRYKFDRDWLLDKMDFDIDSACEIFKEIRDSLQSKAQKLNFHLPRDRSEAISKIKSRYPNEDIENEFDDAQPSLELSQYMSLFRLEDTCVTSEHPEIRKEDIYKTFYDNLLQIFTIETSTFKTLQIIPFLRNFSIKPDFVSNCGFKTIGDYNQAHSHPIMQVSKERYVALIPFLISQALYEAPFYWMLKDELYSDSSSRNRGDASEVITFDLLVKLFGSANTFRGVKIEKSKQHTETDIDILCIAGPKALVVQVKSKKLTELARKGDDAALKKDFTLAVQDAFNQGKKAKQSLLENDAKFVDKYGKQIFISKDLNEIFILALTTENYPSLTHQYSTMLEKETEDSFPLVLTIFDLELLTHYLNDPYSFMFYVRQRIETMDKIHGEGEMDFLGYHLMHNLWPTQKAEKIIIDTSFSKLIDRNYFPARAGLNVPEDSDPLASRWSYPNFTRFYNEVLVMDYEFRSEILFYLLSLSGSARENLMKQIYATRMKTFKDGNFHSFSLPPDQKDPRKIGFTYYSSASDDIKKSLNGLMEISIHRKYWSSADEWISVGSLKNSSKTVDFSNWKRERWSKNCDLESRSMSLNSSRIFIGKKPGRNDLCYCGSDRKYKKCCISN